MSLQLAPSVGRACVLVSALVNHGRIKLPSIRVPREDHFSSGVCYTKASLLFPRTHTVVVITQPSLRSTLQSTDYTGGLLNGAQF